MAAMEALRTLAVLLAAGSLVAVAARRLRVPDVALFLLAGVALGPAALGWVRVPAAGGMNAFVLLLGASWLLFEGGMALRFAVLRRIWITVALLSTLGVAITAAITGAAAQRLLGLPWAVALLLGAVLAPTDPATLVPVFRQVRIRERVTQAAISESACNDATGAILALALLGIAQGGVAPDAAALLGGFARQAGLGMVVGIVLGGGACWLVARRQRALLADFAAPVLLAGVAGAYVLAEQLHASGFMAVFVLGLVFGNQAAFGFAMEPQARQRFDDFAGIASLVLRLLIFMLLGTQVDFALLGRYALPAAAVVAIFMLLARPVAVAACAAPDRRARWSVRELLFLCWTRETGVIPAALAGLLGASGAPGADVILAVTFAAILATLLIQATTTRALAQRLGLLEGA
ncbi:MAG TPA: sodium:proton antiporter [Candidatus Binatia bacterium]|nr:sodium:proton antiporter [Candidatus Binatia bacterium]